MDSEKIKLTKEIFRVLSSETRITLLKKLAQRRMTVSELSRELNVAKSTVHEHLLLMTASGLIISASDDHIWKYYEITGPGKNLLLPENSTKFVIILSFSGFLCAIGALAAFIFAWLSTSTNIPSTPLHGAGHLQNAVPDLIFTCIGIFLFLTAGYIFIRLIRICNTLRKDAYIIVSKVI